MKHAPINPTPRHRPAKTRKFAVTIAILSATLLMGASDGSWLHRVSHKDHARLNPYTQGTPAHRDATSAGAHLFHEDCARCHGEDALGLHNRPSLASDRLAHATDGDLFWMLANGDPWKGMPGWSVLPPAQRWQIVTYLRSLNGAELSEEAPNLSHSTQTTPANQAAPSERSR